MFSLETVIQRQHAVNCHHAWLKRDTRRARWLVPWFSFLSLSRLLSLFLTPPPLLDVTLYSLPIHSCVFNRMSEITLKDLKPLQWDCVALPSSLARSLRRSALRLHPPTQILASLSIIGTGSCRSNPRESRLITRTLHEINVIHSLSVFCQQPFPPPVWDSRKGRRGLQRHLQPRPECFCCLHDFSFRYLNSCSFSCYQFLSWTNECCCLAGASNPHRVPLSLLMTAKWFVCVFKKGLLHVNYVTSAWRYTNEHPHSARAFLSFIRFDPPPPPRALGGCSGLRVSCVAHTAGGAAWLRSPSSLLL